MRVQTLLTAIIHSRRLLLSECITYISQAYQLYIDLLLVHMETCSPIKTVKCDKGPKAIGPYSVAKIFNGVAFVSGQIPLDPIEMKIVEGGIENETHQVMKNLSAVLESSGSSLDKVLKCTIYLVVTVPNDSGYGRLPKGQ